MVDISVIIPAYKAERWLARAIESALSQPNVDVEIIVVEDGIFDNTKEVVERYPDVKLITLPENRDLPAARNRGLEKASADFVMFHGRAAISRYGGKARRDQRGYRVWTVQIGG